MTLTTHSGHKLHPKLIEWYVPRTVRPKASRRFDRPSNIVRNVAFFVDNTLLFEGT